MVIRLISHELRADSPRPFFFQHNSRRFEKKHNIQPHVPITDIPGIEGYPLFIGRGIFRVTHLKALCQAKKAHPWRENEIFSSMVVSVIDCFTNAAISISFRYQSLLYQSPIRIKVIGAAIDP